MSRLLCTLGLVLLLASCGSRDHNSAPRNMDNACSIVSQRPEYLQAFRAAERRWGVPMHVQMATIYHESRFVSKARPPHRFALGIIPMGRMSTAFGYSQALDGTWDEYRRDTGRAGARRERIRDAADFMGWYMAGSRDRLGISLSDARNQYLAYHEGRTGFSRGSYKQKSWLLRVAAQVQSRADMYESQLAGCRRARRG